MAEDCDCKQRAGKASAVPCYCASCSGTALCTHCETCGPPAPECGPTAGKWGCYGVLGAAPAAEAEAPSLRALAHTDSHSAHARSLANNSLLTSRTGACPLPPLA